MRILHLISIILILSLIIGCDQDELIPVEGANDEVTLIPEGEFERYVRMLYDTKEDVQTIEEIHKIVYDQVLLRGGSDQEAGDFVVSYMDEKGINFDD